MRPATYWNGEPAGDLDAPRLDPARAYLVTLAPAGRKAQRAALRKAARFFGAADFRLVNWHLLTAEHLTNLREHLASSCAPAYANRILVAVKRVLRECWRMGLLEASELERRCDVRAIPNRDEVPGRMLFREEQRRLFEAAARRGDRDHAIVAVLLGGGLRASELLHLVAADVSADGLDVRGKGGVRRLVPLPHFAASSLATWQAARGDQPGRLFPLSPKGLAWLLDAIGTAAGVARFTPHDCRRTWISTLLDRGADLAVVARMAGHASVRTTARYDRRPLAAAQRAAALLDDQVAP